MQSQTLSFVRATLLLLLLLLSAEAAPAEPAPFRIAADQLEQAFVAARVRTDLYLYSELDPDTHRLYLPRRVGALVPGEAVRFLMCPEEPATPERCRLALDPKRAAGERLFRLTRPTRVEGQERILTVLDAEGWESNPAPLASWRIEGDDLVLEGFADHVLLTSLSRLEILEARPIRDAELLVVGQIRGGDGGEMWRTFWVARWKMPESFEVVFWIQAIGGSREAIAIEHPLDSELRLEVRVPPSDLGFLPDQSFATTLDLADLFRRRDAGQSLLQIHRAEGWVKHHHPPH